MSKLIGITAYTDRDRHIVGDAYVRAFFNNYGDVIPVITPVYPLEKAELYFSDDSVNKAIGNIADRLDGLVLTGGGDINPLNYNEKNKKSFQCNTVRDVVEMTLAQAFIDRDKPVLGICRGFQLLGLIYRFGNFIQDLSMVKGEIHAGAEVSGDNAVGDRGEPLHSVRIFGDFKKWLIDKCYINADQGYINVNSWHHQGFSILNKAKPCSTKNLEKGVADYGDKYDVEVIASTNRIIEGFRHKTKPVVGIQYHPEEYDFSFTINYFIEKYVLNE